MEKLESWLHSIGLGKLTELFRANDIDVDVVPHLTEKDLVSLGVSLGDRKRLMRAIAALVTGGAERRRLTFMFCDLVGSTDLAGRLDPEEVTEIIRRYYDTVWRVVVRFGGQPVRLLGDGVLIYFGWPRAHEDQVHSAVTAALAVIEEIGRLEAEPGTPVECRIGIATGVAVVGEIGGDINNAVGTAPNLAARLQSMTPPQSVLIDEATYEEVNEQFLFEARAPLDLKGFAEPVRSWRVINMLPGETRFSPRAGHHLLIGRDSELAILQDAWRRAGNGHGRAVLLSGEPGIGKSRLLEALIDEAGIPAVARLRYQCMPHHSDTPLYPILQHLTRMLGLHGSEPPPAQRKKLDAFLRPLFPEDAETLEVFAQLLDLPTSPGWTDRQPPTARRRQIIEDMVGILPQLAARQPLLVLVEDIQWSDPTTEQIIRVGIERLANSPILLVVTSRKPFAQRWFVGAQVGAMSIVRLDGEESAALVRGIAGGALDETTIRQIADRGDGIPLFLTELTKAVLETRVTALGPGSAGQIEGGLPTTLHASLNSRLDHLGPTKRLAQVGAVIGREFSPALLAHVLERDVDSLEPQLRRLVMAGLAERREGNVATLWFSHALVQEAAYATLLLSDRKQLHGRVLDAHDKLAGAVPEPEAQVLAEHATLAERWDKAAAFLGQAYANATRRSANREAISIFNRAIEVLGRLPVKVAAPHAIDLRLHAFTAFHTIGANDKLLELIREAERLAEAIDDPHRLAAATSQMAFALWLEGKHPEAEARANAALALAKLPEDLPLVVGALFNLANIQHAQGRVAEAVGTHRKVLELLPGKLNAKRFGWPAPPSIFSRAFASWYLLELGRFGEATQLLEEAALLAPTEAHGRVMVDTGRGNVLMRRGEFARAAEVLRETLDLCQRAEVLTMYPIVAAWLGHALCGSGHIDEALAVMTDAVKRETYKFGGKYTWIHLRLGLAEAYRLAGQLETAASEAELAWRIADESGEVVHCAYAIVEKARIALARGDAKRALHDATAAFDTARERGLQPLMADCQWLRARAHDALGEADGGREAFGEARRLLVAIGLDDRVFAAPDDRTFAASTGRSARNGR
jgi:class 3 adenylate cyclase/tetratricopeptide (TPR) repeat protein